MTDKVLPTPDEVLDFWFGEAVKSPEVAQAQNKLWFQKSFATDQEIARRFLPLLIKMVNTKASVWAAQGPRTRLAAIITLDQFSRNIFRGHRLAFAHDRLALSLTEAGCAKGEDTALSEVERIFFYLPLEHSENFDHQARCVALFERLVQSCQPGFKPLIESTLDYARAHYEVIERFGRFPHRNTILARPSTPEEKAYLDTPGSGF